MLRLLFNSLLGVVVLLYPVAAYFGLQVMTPWHISAILLIGLILRFFLLTDAKKFNYVPTIILIIYCLFSIWHNSELSLRLYPVLVNFCLLLIFSISLFYPPPIIERLARLQHSNLPTQGVIYTRKVTQIWCLFFFLNGLMALGTAFWASFFWWSLYNGCIAYVLMGLLMGVEYLIRLRTQAHVH